MPRLASRRLDAGRPQGGRRQWSGAALRLAPHLCIRHLALPHRRIQRHIPVGVPAGSRCRCRGAQCRGTLCLAGRPGAHCTECSGRDLAGHPRRLSTSLPVRQASQASQVPRACIRCPAQAPCGAPFSLGVHKLIVLPRLFLPVSRHGRLRRSQARLHRLHVLPEGLAAARRRLRFLGGRHCRRCRIEEVAASGGC